MGTPPQQFHVLPNFGGQTIYVPRDEDCKRLVNLSDCGTQRGVEIFSSAYSPGFQPNASSTWKVLGDYDLALGGVYGLNGFAKWGNDSAGAGMIRSTDLPKLENVAVVAYVAPDFWIGQLGLSPSTIDMNAGNQPHSFLRRMKDEGHIPSLSFGYQAGAPYRKDGLPRNIDSSC